MQNKIFRVIYTLNQIKSMFGLWGEEKPEVLKENKTVAEQSGEPTKSLDMPLGSSSRFGSHRSANAASQVNLKFSSNGFSLASRP